jgi:hypothetical protein
MSAKWLLFVAVGVFAYSASAQTVAPSATITDPRAADLLGGMSADLSRISTSVEKLSGNWKSFFDSFSTNQGLRLSEKQQKILLAFEVLNRSEQRLANLQKMRMEATERQSAFRLRLARINDDLLPESVDRYVSARGSLNAEQLRDIRRQALIRERTELTAVVGQIQRDLDTIETEIRETQRLISGIRERLFSQIQAELGDF